jgi:hypothetical protein
MKTFNKIFFLIFLLPAGIILAGSIKGKVTNGTKGYKVPANTMVELNRYQGNSLDNTFKLSVPLKNGKFVFDNLPSNPNYAYEPVVTYQNVKYYGKSKIVSTQKPNPESDIMIYESTRSDSAISIKMHHFLINSAQGFINIKEIQLIKNDGDKTYVGSVPAQGGKYITANYYLPQGATEVTLGDGLMSCCVVASDKGFYDTMEILPGQKSIAFMYKLNAEDKTINFVKELARSTNELDVIIDDNAVSLSSNKLSSNSAPNMSVKRYSAENLKAGESVDIKLAGLTGAPTNWSNIALGISAVVLLGIGFVVYSKQKKQTSNTEAKDEPGNSKSINTTDHISREELLDKIINLDEKYESGNIEEKVYKTKRNELKNMLKEL